MKAHPHTEAFPNALKAISTAGISRETANLVTKKNLQHSPHKNEACFQTICLLHASLRPIKLEATLSPVTSFF